MAPHDRLLIPRLTVGILLACALFAALHRLHHFYARKLHDSTGRAVWIWQRSELSREAPVAFFATRDFHLPPNRSFTRIKVAADPQYVLYFNGMEIGGRMVAGDHRLDFYDVSSLARTGRNRIVVAVRSAKGVGGLLVAVDLSAEVANFLVSDRTWGVVRVWSPDLLWRDPQGVQQPMILGEPPAGRWNFLTTAQGEPSGSRSVTILPRSTFDYKAALPVVKVVQGVTIASSRRVRARAFDFGGFVDARARVRLQYDTPVSHLVYIRFTNAREELFTLEGNLQSVVFAARERVVTYPEMRHFRYIGVYGGEAVAEAVK